MAHHSSITNHNVLAPAILRTIHEAFDDVVKTIETRWGPYTSPAWDPMRAKVARRMVDLAKHGECDIARLREGALKAIHLDS